MRNFRSIFHNALTFFFSLLGFSSCIHMAYGCPSADFRVVGQAKDVEGQPIRDVRVYDCTYTSSPPKNQHPTIDVHSKHHYFNTISDSTRTDENGSYVVSVTYKGCDEEVFLIRFDHPEYTQKDTVVSFVRGKGGTKQQIVNVTLEKKQ
ncbi:MAG: radical SAM-associated putative lipoprotein [Paludibacteraceae bacterium]|nr:radical SAM-associated putative lipoprotein [Paludibacteraceae bacterium]